MSEQEPTGNQEREESGKETDAPGSRPRITESAPPPTSSGRSSQHPYFADREPATVPKGFWRRVDYILHHPEEIMESLRRDLDLWKLSIVFLLISIVMGGIYGAVMGGTNLLQGSVMPMNGKIGMIVVTAIKVPVLFLLTLLIVLPPVYVSNTFAGARLSFRQMLALLLASTCIAVTVLASMASVAFFFSLTSRSYHFLKLLHVVFFMYAGLAGISFLMKCVRDLSMHQPRRQGNWAFVLLLVLYMFVGTQLAWVLRPFVASPGEEFQVFRPRSGSFYESVFVSIFRAD